MLVHFLEMFTYSFDRNSVLCTGSFEILFSDISAHLCVFVMNKENRG